MHLLQMRVLFIFYIYLLSGDSVFVTSMYSEPEILSKFETIIKAGDNHTVFCQGNEPLKWTVPRVEKEQQSWTTFVTTSQQPKNENYKYGMTLQIFNMSYPFIGFYYCHYDSSDTNDSLGTKKIYLFVDDPDHFTTLELEGVIKQVPVTQYQEAVIPCKPTVPDIQVSLINFSNGSPIEEATYDPKTGFKFFVSDLSQQDIYLCTFSRNSESVDALVHLTVHSSLPVTYLYLPFLQDESDGHTIVGDNLKLKCKIKSNNEVYFQWGTPSGSLDKRMKTETGKRNGYIWQTLTITNTTISDNGFYSCNVTDNQHHSSNANVTVKIFEKDEYFLNMTEENGLYSLTARVKDPSVQWSITVHGHPKPSVIWLNNKNATIRMEKGNKYEASYDHTKRAVLKIKDIDINDNGIYTLLASNNKTEKNLTLDLNVTDKPTVILKMERFYLINTSNNVTCSAIANPEPEFQWYFNGIQINGTISKRDGFTFESQVTINTSQHGYLKCSAQNYLGSSSDVKYFYVSDVKNGFDIYGFERGVNIDEEKKEIIIAEDDTVTAICGASNYMYTEVTWLFNNIPITKHNTRYGLASSKTKYSDKLKLEIKQANISDNGLYSCRVSDNEYKNYSYINMTFTVASPTKPVLNTTLEKEKQIDIPTPLTMFCEVKGIPKPTLMWYKNGNPFLPSDSKRINISENKETIVFSSTAAEDEGTYKCRAENKIGIAEKEQILKFKNLPRTPYWVFAIIMLLSLLSVGTIVFIIIKIRKEKQLQKELKELGLSNFKKGAIENINPELGIDDQAELLPYDQKWEFPIERLKLGKQLGSGAFGVVMKGLAKNIVDGEDTTTVAVKMVKKNADHTYIKALASELKIMVHLGKHLNVVNLLGACTKNVAKRELLVIVEFCRFGNLQNYLLRHRDNYVDQVDPKTGKIDYVIGQEFYDRTYSVSSDRSTQSPSLKYAALAFPSSSNQPSLLQPSNDMGDYRANPNAENFSTTDMTTISQGEDTVILSNNSVQPEWRSNYKGDYKGNVKPICTKDLLAWAFQVARGMEYLSSRKVLHGDLAARNILLADNNIVKICDFGLAKSMYKNDNYKKKGDGPLPIKWMAIESIRDRVFSTQSDVWSFGIVLWEFFSLARTPYPGMAADERLYQKLLDGYRMESPPYAPKDIYKMMTECWSSKPLARPSFTKLSEHLGNMLEDSLRKHYIDLNDPYLVMNTQRLESGQSDYLAMLSPPTFEVLSTPHYVNEMVGQQPFEDLGYLSMKPNTIFSPRVEEGSMFDFNVNNRKHLDSSEENTMELLPMLRRESDSGCETQIQSPITPNSFSNPSYHIPPNITEDKKNISNNNSNIVKSPDNYINMPQSKNFNKEKIINQNNPFLDSSNQKENPHYVNNTSNNWESEKV